MQSQTAPPFFPLVEMFSDLSFDRSLHTFHNVSRSFCTYRLKRLAVESFLVVFLDRARLCIRSWANGKYAVVEDEGDRLSQPALTFHSCADELFYLVTSVS